MRLFKLVVALMVLAHGAANAQSIVGFEAKTLTCGSGESAISNGISCTVAFTPADGSAYAEVTLQAEQAWIIIARNISLGGVSMTVGPSAGFFQQAPLVGPYVLLEVPLAKNVGFTGLYWPAIFPFREPADWHDDGIANGETVNIGHFGELGLVLGPVKLSVAGLDFLDDKTNWLPGVALSQKIGAKFVVTQSLTQNTNTDKLMYNLAVGYLFR